MAAADINKLLVHGYLKYGGLNGVFAFRCATHCKVIVDVSVTGNSKLRSAGIAVFRFGFNLQWLRGDFIAS